MNMSQMKQMHDYCICELNDFNSAVLTLNNIEHNIYMAAELVYYRYLFGTEMNIASVKYFQLFIFVSILQFNQHFKDQYYFGLEAIMYWK
jgi:hypothetical protein